MWSFDELIITRINLFLIKQTLNKERNETGKNNGCFGNMKKWVLKGLREWPQQKHISPKEVEWRPYEEKNQLVKEPETPRGKWKLTRTKENSEAETARQLEHDRNAARETHTDWKFCYTTKNSKNKKKKIEIVI